MWSCSENSNGTYTVRDEYGQIVTTSASKSSAERQVKEENDRLSKK